MAESAPQADEPVDALAYRNFLSRYWIVPGKDHHLDGEANRVAAQALAQVLVTLLPGQ